jgi:hypothetical protein
VFHVLLLDLVPQFVIVTLTFCEPHGVLKTSVKLPRVLFNDETVNVLPEPLTLMLLGPSVNATVPLGLTVKLTVPLPCFENESGSGLVVTWTVHGVGVTIGLGDGLAPGDAAGLALGDADGEAPGDGLAPGDADGDASGDGLWVGVGDGSVCGDGVAVGDGCGLLLPFIVEPLSISVIPSTITFTLGTSSR